MQLDELINAHYNRLNENDLYIWNYIASHKKECEKLTIDQLAYKCSVSRTTILRFAQKLSLDGYGELKVLLKLDNQKSREELNNVDTVCHSYQVVADNVRHMNCTEIFQKMDSARNIYVYGLGMFQSSLKKELCRIFMDAGIMIFNLDGYDESTQILDLVNDQDLFILISISGENKHVLELARKLKVLNVPILSMTRLQNNTLSHLADYQLYTECTRLPGAFSEYAYESLTVFFILIEILYLKYMQYKTQILNQEESHEVIHSCPGKL